MEPRAAVSRRAERSRRFGRISSLVCREAWAAWAPQTVWIDYTEEEEAEEGCPGYVVDSGWVTASGAGEGTVYISD